MGVKDLWTLLSPIGRRVAIESLERKTLAIDVSIWITQFIKAMRDDEGKMLKNAHLLGTLRRILKLLFHRITPIFVFDGATPKLKEKTVQLRRNRRRATEETHQKNLQKLYLSMLKKEALEAELSKTKGTATVIADGANNGSYVEGFTPWNPSSSDCKGASCESKGSSSSSKAESTGQAGSAIKTQSHPSCEKQSASSSAKDEGDWLDYSDDDDEEDFHEKHLEDDGFENPGKYRSGSSYYNGGRRHRYQLPDKGDFDVDTMAALEVHLRKDIAEDLRRKLRTESRREYLAIKDNAELYSKTQLAHFKLTSDLNKKLVAVQKKVDGASEGNRMDSEAGRMYTMRDASEMNFSENSNSVSDVHKKPVIKELYAAAPKAPQPTVMSPMKAGRPDKESVQARRRMVVVDDDDDDDDDVNISPRVNRRSNLLDLTGTLGTSSGLGRRASAALQSRNAQWVNDQTDFEELEAWACSCCTLLNSVQKTVCTACNQPRSESFVLDDTSGYQKESAPFHQLRRNTNSNNDDDVAWESAGEDDDIRIPGNAIGREQQGANKIEVVLVPHTGRRDEEAGVSEIVTLETTNVEETESFEMTLQETQPTVSSFFMPDEEVQSVESYDLPANANVTFSQESHAPSEADHTPEVPPYNKPSLLQLFKSPPMLIPDRQPEVAIELPSVPTKGVDKKAPILEVEVVKQLPPILEVEVAQQPPILKESLIVPSAERIVAPSTELAVKVPSPDLRELLQEQAVAEKELRRRNNAASRDAEILTEEMKDEVLALLQAFDLPFIVAPYEAEAQCAVLEQLGIVQGVVTEDSDAFLFGAKTVYKNIFNDKKFVEVYLAEDAEREMGLAREDLVALAYFLGSDYTEGVTGVGIVNAMEIIQAFSMRTADGGPLAGLAKFKKWLDGYDFMGELVVGLKSKRMSKAKREESEREKNKKRLKKTSAEQAAMDLDEEEALSGEEEEDDSGAAHADDDKLQAFQLKHKSGRSKWTVPKNFPDEDVASAYLEPQANWDSAKFDCPIPKVHKVRKFCKDVLGWTDQDMDVQIDPIILRYSKKDTQQRIDSFYATYHTGDRVSTIASARLKESVQLITGKSSRSSSQSAKNGNKRKSALSLPL